MTNFLHSLIAKMTPDGKKPSIFELSNEFLYLNVYHSTNNYTKFFTAHDHDSSLDMSHRLIDLEMLFQKKIHRIEIELHIDKKNNTLVYTDKPEVVATTQLLSDASLYEKVINEVYRGRKFNPCHSDGFLEDELLEFAFKAIETNIHSADRDIIKASMQRLVFGPEAHPKTIEFFTNYKNIMMSRPECHALHEKEAARARASSANLEHQSHNEGDTNSSLSMSRSIKIK